MHTPAIIFKFPLNHANLLVEKVIIKIGASFLNLDNYAEKKGDSICIHLWVVQMKAPTQLLVRSSDAGHSTDALFFLHTQFADRVSVESSNIIMPKPTSDHAGKTWYLVGLGKITV